MPISRSITRHSKSAPPPTNDSGRRDYVKAIRLAVVCASQPLLTDLSYRSRRAAAPAARPPERRDAGLRNRRPHVYLNFRGRQRTVVDPHVIDAALEVLTPDRIATDPHGARGDWRRPVRRGTLHEHTVHVHLQGGTIEGCDQMRPCVERQR